MPEARLTLRPPGDAALVEVTTDRDVTVRVLGATTDPEGSVLLLDVRGDDAAAAAADLTTHRHTTRGAVLRENDDVALVHAVLPVPTLDALVAAGVAFEPPLHVADGEGSLVVRTTSGALSELRECLEAANVDFSVAYVHAAPSRSDLLTERQERALAAAVEGGYYESPAGTTITALADDLNLAKSTVSETLRRAERSLATAYLASRGDSDGGDSVRRRGPR